MMIRLYRNLYKVEERIPDTAIVSRIVFAFIMLCAIAYASYIRVPELIQLINSNKKQSACYRQLIVIPIFDNRSTPGDKPGGGS